MNKLVKISISMLLITSSYMITHAQTTASFGIKGGWINSGFIGDDAEEQDKKPGYQIGGVFNITSGNEFIGFQPEFLYSMKNTSFQVGNIREQYKLGYLKVPALIKISLPLESIRPNVFAGPYASFKLTESYTVEDTFTGFTTTGEDNAQSVDYGMVFGGGLDIDLSNTIFMVDVRYDIGMRKLEEAEEPKDIKNGDFSINLGITFKL